ncbi:hypothetical protein UG55_103878 [Frankia sp. EI5c]|uniref:baeRF2 domain-containing protein n=1 Tax=Frankia sp. EI5c TaxID=683316 RepID=UPI0007C25A52|nr:Vms1/Ankzf1 family peptidyl-tRNA hydrolase [Frankia sp. EI5c]OAA23381.1 hypothetical protein UG55_103878 [Frankia sp. EI5c]
MDTSQLRNLYSTPGRFVTVYASVDPTAESAGHLYELRWQDALAELAKQGVEEPLRRALFAERGDPREGGTRVVVAATGTGPDTGTGRDRGATRVPYARWLPGRGDIDLVAVGSLPNLLPVIDWMDRRVAHVVALVDRLGVDVLAYTDQPLPVNGVSRDVTPAPWHKTGAGGWAQKRYESRVEENWKQGAKQSAALINQAARDITAEVVILAGDPKALPLVRAELPIEIASRVEVVQGSRARDGSDEHLASQINAVLAEWNERRATDLLARFERYRSRARALAGAGPADDAAAAAAGGAVALDAADGPAQTAAALRRSQVSHLLLAQGVRADTPAWIGPGVTEVALDPADLPGAGLPGAARPVPAGLVDALIRAALGTGAEIHCVPATAAECPTSGVGALLRYPAPTSS